MSEHNTAAEAHEVLLLIDFQNVYAEGGAWQCAGTQQAAERVCALLHSGFAEKNGIDVIFTRFLAAESPGGVWREYNHVNAEINADSRANEMLQVIRDELQAGGYPLYTKSVYSSLAIPEVLQAAQNAACVAVGGVVAECCVLSTVMALIDAGIPVIYLTDGVAGQTPETAKAVETILAGLEPLHVRRMTIQEYQNRI